MTIATGGKKAFKDPGRAAAKPSMDRDLQASIQDEIARTYFKTSSEKPSAPRKGAAQKLPWLVAVLALAIALTAMFTKSKLDVRVMILSEIPSVTVEGGRVQFDNLKDKGVFLLKGTETNGELVKRISFDGDAASGSRTTDDNVVLSNSRGSGWANYTIELKEPVDLGRLDLKFVARGNSGGELLGVVIMDSEKRSYRMERDASTQLTRQWQMYSINFRPVRKAVDLSGIKVIKFEFGNLTVGNSAGATIFLKDIYLSKARRSRWL